MTSLHCSLRFGFSWTPRNQSSSGSAHLPALRRSRPTCGSYWSAEQPSTEPMLCVILGSGLTANWRWSVTSARSLRLVSTTSGGCGSSATRSARRPWSSWWRRLYWVVSTIATSFSPVCPRRPLILFSVCWMLPHVLFCVWTVGRTLLQHSVSFTGYRWSSASNSNSQSSCINLQLNGVRHTSPTSSTSARRTHSDDLCARLRRVQPSFDVRALNSDDVR